MKNVKRGYRLPTELHTAVYLYSIISLSFDKIILQSRVQSSDDTLFT